MLTVLLYLCIGFVLSRGYFAFCCERCHRSYTYDNLPFFVIVAFFWPLAAVAVVLWRPARWLIDKIDKIGAHLGKRK